MPKLVVAQLGGVKFSFSILYLGGLVKENGKKKMNLREVAEPAQKRNTKKCSCGELFNQVFCTTTSKQAKVEKSRLVRKDL
jgi:hypothetical protein